MNAKQKQSLAEEMLNACGIDDVDGPDTVEDWVEKIFTAGRFYQAVTDSTLISDDAFCATFQTIGQYRSAILNNISATWNAKP